MVYGAQTAPWANTVAIRGRGAVWWVGVGEGDWGAPCVALDRGRQMWSRESAGVGDGTAGTRKVVTAGVRLSYGRRVTGVIVRR